MTYCFPLDSCVLGYGHLKRRQRARSVAISLNSTLAGIEISPASSGGIKALKEYCSKKETRVRGPWSDGVRYLGRDIISRLYPYQSQICDKCQEAPNNRTINWLANRCGNSGKSSLVKYMIFNYDAVGLTYSTAANITNIVYKMECERHRSIYMFDLTRAKPKDYASEDLYACMEAIKNGCVMNSKYETGIKMFEPPHIWVFANMMPDFTQCSADRWRVWVLDKSDPKAACIVLSKQNVEIHRAKMVDFD